MYSFRTHRRLTASVGALFLTFSFLFTSGPALAVGGLSGNLNGRVVEATNAAPVANADVRAESPSGTYHAKTDSAGFFSFLQIPTDTYTVAVEKQGYVRQAIPGVVVFGDETNSVGTIKLARDTLKTIARVTSRTQSSAFQPHQTIDETTFVGARVDQALGQAGSTNYNQLALSAPGVVQTTAGNLSIRGSLGVEIGYQFDGVNMEGSFFDENANLGFLNGVGGGQGSFQVVSGSGDATQGNVGAGVLNVVPGRGTYPGKGFVSFGVGSPFYNHNFAMQYGIATPNNRFSDFVSIRSARFTPNYAPYGADAGLVTAPNAAGFGEYYGVGYSMHDDVLNNFLYHFGKNNKEQIQVLTDFINLTQYGNYGGLTNALYYPYDPFSYSQNIGDYFGTPYLPGATTAQQLAYYQRLLTYFPGVPTTNTPPKSPEVVNYQPVTYVKLGYTNQLSPSTIWNTFYYNWGGLEGGAGTNFISGSGNPSISEVGGRRVGFQSQITHQAGEHHTLTLIGKFENSYPRWDTQGAGALFFTFGLDPYLYAGTYQPGGNNPNIADWYLPQTPGLPVSASNPCIGPGGAAFSTDGNYQNDPSGCYIYDYLLSKGKWNGTLPKIPPMGIGYHNSDFQSFGYGIRDQWQPNDKLRFDLGLRMDGQNIKFGPNPFALDPYGNPSDVNPNSIGNDFSRPRIVEPRISASYDIDRNNSVRAGYGRSVIFFFGQNGGTPAAANLKYWDPVFAQIPAKDQNAGNAFGPFCGSGWHGPGQGYTQNSNNYYSGAGTGYYFKCSSYAQSLFWAYDQLNDAPDLGGQGPPTYNNYDLEFQHQFKGGWGAKLTAFGRRGFNVEQNTLLLNGPPNPVTGQSSASVFATRDTGIEKTVGLEAMLTAPLRDVGWSGYLTLNYINELLNTPPVAGSDNLPILPQNLLLTGTLFHANFLPPFSAVAGVTYKTRTGWKINPIFNYNAGVPFGVGKDAIGYVNGVLYHLPETNFGIATPYAGPNGPGNSYNASYYVDPAFPGNYFSPNISASRGYDEPAFAGQSLTRPRLYTDLDLEYTRGKITIGTYITNVFNNYRSQPQVNTAWQPVATGIGGPQSGLYSGAYPGSDLYVRGARDIPVFDLRNSPYLEFYVPGRTFNVYTQFNI